MQGVLTRSERAAIFVWRLYRRSLSEPNLVPTPKPLGRADRYYRQGKHLVGVEVTRLLVPAKQRIEADADRFLMREVAPLVAGHLPGRFYGFIDLPWHVPPKGSPDRRALAGAVANLIVSRSPRAADLPTLTDVSVHPYVSLSIHPSERSANVSELVWGGSNSLYGGFEGPVNQEQREVIQAAVTSKAAKGQLSSDLDHRVLLLQDKMFGIEPFVFNDAVTTLPREVVASFDEIVLVSSFNAGRCIRAAI
jgi:hypothetical protein